MSASGSKPVPAIGFLTICDFGDSGVCGGYLVLNAAGRPLEFHCTAPVKANRAQEILYGPTLRPFLFGEQIGQTLITRSKVEALVVVTDVEAALAVRPFVSMPVVNLVGDVEKPAHPAVLVLNKQSAAVERGHPRDAEAVKQFWPQHFEAFDLREPFGRIREALDESRKAA
ncbi:MAG TPA: hypothetical protein VL096_19215 [Pirellulaceae bacterium]|nr:hypothetical protein [Pirellulaceae bacterium]